MPAKNQENETGQPRHHIFFLGLPGAGKTAIRQVMFHGKRPEDVLEHKPTTRHVKFVPKENEATVFHDFGGSSEGMGQAVDVVKEISSKDQITIAWLIDVSDPPSLVDSIQALRQFIEHVQEHREQFRVLVVAHKKDLLSVEQSKLVATELPQKISKVLPIESLGFVMTSLYDDSVEAFIELLLRSEMTESDDWVNESVDPNMIPTLEKETSVGEEKASTPKLEEIVSTLDEIAPEAISKPSKPKKKTGIRLGTEFQIHRRKRPEIVSSTQKSEIPELPPPLEAVEPISDRKKKPLSQPSEKPLVAPSSASSVPNSDLTQLELKDFVSKLEKTKPSIIPTSTSRQKEQSLEEKLAPPTSPKKSTKELPPTLLPPSQQSSSEDSESPISPTIPEPIEQPVKEPPPSHSAPSPSMALPPPISTDEVPPAVDSKPPVEVSPEIPSPQETPKLEPKADHEIQPQLENETDIQARIRIFAQKNAIPYMRIISLSQNIDEEYAEISHQHVPELVEPMISDISQQITDKAGEILELEIPHYTLFAKKAQGMLFLLAVPAKRSQLYRQLLPRIEEHFLGEPSEEKKQPTVSEEPEEQPPDPRYISLEASLPAVLLLFTMSEGVPQFKVAIGTYKVGMISLEPIVQSISPLLAMPSVPPVFRIPLGEVYTRKGNEYSIVIASEQPLNQVQVEKFLGQVLVYLALLKSRGEPLSPEAILENPKILESTQKFLNKVQVLRE